MKKVITICAIALAVATPNAFAKESSKHTTANHPTPTAAGSEMHKDSHHSKHHAGTVSNSKMRKDNKGVVTKSANSDSEAGTSMTDSNGAESGAAPTGDNE